MPCSARYPQDWHNEIKVYHRSAAGSLSLVQTIATGGGGSGLQLAGVDALGYSGSLQLDDGHRILFAVNTESAAENNGASAYNTDCQQGTITSFLVAADGTLTFADRVFSRGMFPNSLAVRRNLLYVLNSGGPEVAICHITPSSANLPNITGFTFDKLGRMNPFGSTRPIDPGPASSAGGVSCTAAAAAGFAALTGAPAADFQCGLNPPSFVRSPAQVGFSPDGHDLVVTVKGTNMIYVFQVDQRGAAGEPTTFQVPGPALPTYFGFTFDGAGDLLLVEMFGSSTSIPAGGTGAVSSFQINKADALVAGSSHVADGGTAPVSITMEPITGAYAYVANNLSASISSYAVGRGGVLTLLNGTAASGSGPNDMATAQENGLSFLYVLDAGIGTLGAFRINLADGSLTALTGDGGLPAGRSSQGLAAY